MKRVLSVCIMLLLLVSVLPSCGTGISEEELQGLSAAVDRLGQHENAALSFHMEAVFSDVSGKDTGVLYSSSGTASYDRNAGNAWQTYSSSLLAQTFQGTDYISADRKVHLEGDDIYTIDEDFTAEFDKYPYYRIQLPKELLSLSVDETLYGKLYTLEAPGDDEALQHLFGLDVYALAGITNPDYDMEEYGKLTCRYSVRDNEIQTVSMEMHMTVYEKGAYRPGYSDRSDNRLDLNLQLSISYTEFDTVSVPIYNN